MNKHFNKAQIQITDLISESVEYAVARRRKELESEGFEIDLSDNRNQDYSQIKGGFESKKGPVRMGKFLNPAPPSEEETYTHGQQIP